MKIENVRNLVTLNRLMVKYSRIEEYVLAAKVRDRIAHLKEFGGDIEKEEEFLFTVKIVDGSPKLIQESLDEWEANNTNNHEAVLRPGEREPLVGDKMRIIKWCNSVNAELAVKMSKLPYLIVSKVLMSNNEGFCDYTIWFEESEGIFFNYEECEFVD